MKVVLYVQRQKEPAGVARQGRDIATWISSKVDVTVRNVRQRELVLCGRRRFGYTSLMLRRLVPLRGGKSDIVHVTDNGILPLWGRSADIVQIYDPFPWLDLAVYQSRMVDALFQSSHVPAVLRARALVCATEHTANIVRELFAREVCVIHCGVDTGFWYAAKLVKWDKPTVLGVGILGYPRKDVNATIDACVSAGVDLRIVGSSARHDEATLLRHTDRFRANGADFKLLGYVSDWDLRHEYAKAHVVISLSRDEGFGLVPVEAASAGTTSVLSDIASHREVMGNNAYYAKLSDPIASADAIRVALDYPKGAQTLFEYARLYDWSKIVPKWVKLYDELA